MDLNWPLGSLLASKDRVGRQLLCVVAVVDILPYDILYVVLLVLGVRIYCFFSFKEL